MMRRTAFGSNFSLTGFNLGVVSPATQQELELNTQRESTRLDAIAVRIDAAAGSGIANATVSAWTQRRDLLAEDLTRLTLDINDLDQDSDVARWRLEYEHLVAQISELDAAVRAAAPGFLSRERWSVGVWVGAAVLGTVAAVIGIRWYATRRRR